MPISERTSCSVKASLFPLAPDMLSANSWGATDNKSVGKKNRIFIVLVTLRFGVNAHILQYAIFHRIEVSSLLTQWPTAIGQCKSPINLIPKIVG